MHLIPESKRIWTITRGTWVRVVQIDLEKNRCLVDCTDSYFSPQLNRRKTKDIHGWLTFRDDHGWTLKL